jgi:hypothetical protein
VAISLSSVDAVASRIRRAQRVDFGAYVLHPGDIERALTAAAEHGARVHVILQRDPYRGGAGERHLNRDAARVLRAAGATVTLLDRHRMPFHLKAAVCDGTAFLDDRNWAADEREIVLSDDTPRDVAAVRSALRGAGSVDGAIATRKDAALRLEAQQIDAARDAPVLVETEAFGAGPISAALWRHARGGAPTTLLVAAREAKYKPKERALLNALRADGVVVRETAVNEKLMLAGDAAWVGSANATFAGGRAGAQIDWGLVTHDSAVVAAVRAGLQRDLTRAVREDSLRDSRPDSLREQASRSGAHAGVRSGTAPAGWASGCRRAGGGIAARSRGASADRRFDSPGADLSRAT